MPQGVGYSTPLRGPDGGPAIDHVTGQPLTMEELIRRQGIIPWYERVTPTGQSLEAGVDSVGIPPALGRSSATFPPLGASRPTGGAPVETTPGAPPSLDDPTVLADDPEVQQAVASLGPEDENKFWQMVAGGVSAAALAAWLINRSRRKGVQPPAAAVTAAAQPASVPAPKPVSVPAPTRASAQFGAPLAAGAKPVLTKSLRTDLPLDITAPTVKGVVAAPSQPAAPVPPPTEEVAPTRESPADKLARTRRARAIKALARARK